jgi:multiple sugar transport system ATP-binding protein
MAEIVLDQVSKRFKDGTTAVDHTDLTIEDGEFFILVGPSGCGKSTLLNMIVGLEDVTEGEIRVDGQVVNDIDPKDRGMAMVFQSYAIYPHMTVRENMAFPLKLAKLPKDEIARRVDEAATTLELTELLDRKPANLSGGQRQRVAMGRAIVREPKVFLMDEPLSNLDAKLRVQTRGQLAELQDRLGVTTVYVTHDQTEAMTLGDRVAVLRKGVVQQVGTPKELYRDPVNLFVAGFIGSPAMNFVPGDVAGTTLHLPFVDLDLPGELVERYRGGDGSVIVGVRPENFEDVAFVADDLRPSGATFTARVELIEWLGADVFAFFRVGSRGSHEMAELARELESVELPDGEVQRVAAKIDRSSDIAERHEAELWLDGREVHLFDPASGENLTRRQPAPAGDQAVGVA